MKKLFLTIILLSFTSYCYASPSNSISIPNSFTPNTTISSSEMNSNFNEVQAKYDVHTHSDITELGAITTGTWAATIVDTAYGGTGNAYGLGLPTGAVFFMLSGSCPTGSTDVTATYSDMFLKVNATQDTKTTTPILTGATDDYTLLAADIPAHVHSVPSQANAQGGDGYVEDADNSGAARTTNTGSKGGGGAHAHDLSTATTLEPNSFTVKMCQID